MTPDERMNFKVLVEGSTSFDLVEMHALITGEMDKRTAKAAKFLEKEMKAKAKAATLASVPCPKHGTILPDGFACQDCVREDPVKPFWFENRGGIVTGHSAFASVYAKGPRDPKHTEGQVVITSHQMTMEDVAESRWQSLFDVIDSIDADNITRGDQ